MALDLSGVQRVVEGFLTDSLQLWRDVRGETDDVLDEETGVLGPETRAELIWEGTGAVVLSGLPAASPPLDAAVADVPSGSTYQGLLPLGVPSVQSSDLLIVMASIRDTQLVRCRFRITGVGHSSFAVVRVVRLENLGVGRPHPEAER
ncbi:DUF6093 family protein [Streptomyces acidicola]|uniref:DUF6093 family protein n=1 Tax=Streptomyces acidicola TaxID=2596892 RepID=UPI0037A42380